MIPTLRPGDRVIADRLSLDFGNPSRGEIVVFHPPICSGNRNNEGACTTTDRSLRVGASPETFIKRVVGLPGDRLTIRNGHVIRNGRREADGYTRPCGDSSFCNFPRTIVVPPGDYFMMGDNRDLSDDSRFWGPVPDKWVIGVAFFTYWPPDRIGTI
jgi:signal peptidase I